MEQIKSACMCAVACKRLASAKASAQSPRNRQVLLVVAYKRTSSDGFICRLFFSSTHHLPTTRIKVRPYSKTFLHHSPLYHSPRSTFISITNLPCHSSPLFFTPLSYVVFHLLTVICRNLFRGKACLFFFSAFWPSPSSLPPLPFFQDGQSRKSSPFHRILVFSDSALTHCHKESVITGKHISAGQTCIGLRTTPSPPPMPAAAATVSSPCHPDRLTDTKIDMTG